MNGPPLTLHIPEPKARPGDSPDFRDVVVPQAGSVRRPDIATPAADMRDLAFGMIRVLDHEGKAVGPWKPELDATQLVTGLRTMLLTRALDERMSRMHRQGKISFYTKSTGEEAIGCAQGMALKPTDMCFTSYRQQSLLIYRGFPLLAMMNQLYSNAADLTKGRQLPVLYSSRQNGYWTMSGNVGTRFPHAVGWAMASAYKGDTQIAAAWIGDGATAEGDFHYALTFAAVYRAPVILNIVNNQWAISSFQGLAGGETAPFSARGTGYGLPALRVDGNDFLAVHAATHWAEQRARSNLGATVIELYTYRVAPHSTSDDPSRYRPEDEARYWPLGDPIDRLKQHLFVRGEWSEEQHHTAWREAVETVQATGHEAERIGIGITGSGSCPARDDMFLDVYGTADWRLERQRRGEDL